MLIDGHAHISVSDYGNIELYIKCLNEGDVDLGLIVPGGTMDVREMTLYITGDKDPIQEIPNSAVFDALQKYPDRLRGFVGINPLEESESLKWFEKAVSHKFAGVKLSPMTHQFSYYSEFLDFIAAECSKYGMVMYGHSLFNVGASSEAYGEFAGRNPGTNFILGHMGFGSCDVIAFNLAKELNNLYLEVSLGNFLAINQAVKIATADKIIFGSEFPMSTPSIQKFQINQLEISDEDKSNIFGGNILRICEAL